ncbi:hypothetical protein Ddc_13589 [Ditylenchus destructor]|nr:hypothetical protein Ddc_13589 [Ditylenchus destructor]
MNETIRDTFAFLNRLKIMTIFLSTSNKFLYKLCFQKFMSSPPLVLPSLNYRGDQWKWYANEFGISSEPENSFEYVVRISDLQFIRFERCCFLFKIGVSTPPAKTLRQVSNLWDNASLYLRTDEFAVTEQLASLVSTCRKLNLSGTNVMVNLDKLLTGKCEDVDITDLEATVDDLPIETIVDFLFYRKNNCAPKLRLTIDFSFNYDSLFEAVKERFMASTTGCKFKLEVSSRSGHWLQGRALKALNEEIEQILHLKEGWRAFQLYTP